MKEVEILKIGKIMPVIPIKGTRMYDTSQFGKPTIMVVCDGGPIFDYYVSMLKEHCDEYRYLNTAQNIVGKIITSNSSLLSKLTDTLKGIPDCPPIVGEAYTINNTGRGWKRQTIMVEKIINDNLFISENSSVFAIHDLSQFRDKKLNDLGI
jgi:hypothetical protein